MVKYIRVSIGTASMLGLTKIRMMAKPTTAYLMTYYPERCMGNCSFCTQARTSRAESNYLSRIVWPKYPFKKVLSALEKSTAFKRVCLQVIIYPNYVSEALEIISNIKSIADVPISVSIYPRNREDLIRLKEVGAERIGIGVDTVSEKLFRQIKSSFSWRKTLNLMDDALEIFGRNKVSVHLIYGLGEKDVDFIKFMLNLHRKGARIGLFAFTPVEGTQMAHMRQPSQSRYRAIQLAHYLIVNESAEMNDFKFDENGNLRKINLPKNKLLRIIRNGEPFTTKGCPNCNRPFYNEPPRKPLYNYPLISMAREDISIILKQLEEYIF